MVKSTSRAFSSDQIRYQTPYSGAHDLQTGGNICSRVGAVVKITLFLEAPPPKQDKLDAHQFWSILRTFLILILVSAFVVWLSYVVFYMVTN